jgi:hypothetical protein
MPVIPDTQEMDFRRIKFQGQPRQKVGGLPSQPTSQKGMVADRIYNPNYVGGISRKVTV